jgi:Family of unknown function (DUF6455)
MNFFSYLKGMNKGGELKDAMAAKLGLKQAMDALPDHANVHERAQKRCMTCNNAAECATWLATENTPSEAPEYCRNHDLFARITDKIQAHSA